jgi:hypothetical protein
MKLNHKEQENYKGVNLLEHLLRRLEPTVSRPPARLPLLGQLITDDFPSPILPTIISIYRQLSRHGVARCQYEGLHYLLYSYYRR